MPSDSEVVSVDDLRPGQDYYIVGTSWGKAPPADKAHEHGGCRPRMTKDCVADDRDAPSSRYHIPLFLRRAAARAELLHSRHELGQESSRARGGRAGCLADGGARGGAREGE